MYENHAETAVTTSPNVQTRHSPMLLYSLASAVIGERVRRKITPEALAVELGVPAETILDVEQGRVPADFRFLQRLADAVGVILPDELVCDAVMHR